MTPQQHLSPEFRETLKRLEEAYVSSDDPIHQSGFGGGAARWRAEREPILAAIQKDCELLDIGCANGFLLECLMEWGRERGVSITPYGLEQGARLVDLARARLPGYAKNFFHGNVWEWSPPRAFPVVYMVYDCVPNEFLEELVNRLLANYVSPGGRLILGAYGSRSRGDAPFDIAGFLQANGFDVAGVSQGGDPAVTSFAWINAA